MNDIVSLLEHIIDVLYMSYIVNLFVLIILAIILIFIYVSYKRREKVITYEYICSNKDNSTNKTL